jgi:hypothetical protein
MLLETLGTPMLKQFTLYWTNLTRFENCPQHFLWSRGWGSIDLGNGPGKKKTVPVESSRHHAIMGIAVQAAVEDLYNKEFWKHPGVADRMVESARRSFDLELQRSFVDFRLAPSREEMWKVVEDGVRGYLRTFKQHRLVGPYARSEVDLTGFLRPWLPIGGKADVIIRREDTGVTILDGKNGKRYVDRKTGQWMTYTDPDQLRWYALCFYICYRKLPDRLGFTFFRFPYGAPMVGVKGDPVLDAEGEPQVESGVDWVPFDKEDLKGLAERAIQARNAMDKEKFGANPVPSYCRMCDYETCCAERQEQRQKNARPRKVPEALENLEGLKEFSL